MKFVSKKANFPPLGLLTVAAMLPAQWEKRLVDMNVSTLSAEDIKWADYVFIGAMAVQVNSTREIIARCKSLDARIVAGGPLFTTAHEEFDGVEHFVLDEAEITLPPFLADLAEGCPKQVYSSDQRPDITNTPVPLWSLLNMKHYSAMSIQYSRGCPFDCDFCDIVILNGRKPRTKAGQQVVEELDSLYRHGWRGSVFVVDDNFIGNKKELKDKVLPAIIEWSREKRYPFTFFTQASINLADDEQLMDLMTEAGFNRVFIGIETPNVDSLVECNKPQNMNRDLAASVKRIQNRGFEVQGGFVLGFDSDPVSIFASQIDFIQKTGVVTAMVSLLNAPRGTKLYQRLKRENRLLKDMSGDNTDFSINFIPHMPYETLINGYRHVLDTIYAPPNYCERVITFLKEYRPRKTTGVSRLRLSHLLSLAKALWFLGIMDKERRHFWRLLGLTLLKCPQRLPVSISLSVSGFHFRKVAEDYNKALTAPRET